MKTRTERRAGKAWGLLTPVILGLCAMTARAQNQTLVMGDPRIDRGPGGEQISVQFKVQYKDPGRHDPQTATITVPIERGMNARGKADAFIRAYNDEVGNGFRAPATRQGPANANGQRIGEQVRMPANNDGFKVLSIEKVRPDPSVESDWLKLDSGGFQPVALNDLKLKTDELGLASGFAPDGSPASARLGIANFYEAEVPIMPGESGQDVLQRLYDELSTAPSPLGESILLDGNSLSISLPPGSQFGSDWYLGGGISDTVLGPGSDLTLNGRIVPEPASLALLTAGVVVAWSRQRRRSALGS